MSTGSTSSNCSTDTYDSFDHEESDDWTGCILNNKYIPIVELGAGAFATVWLCYNYANKQYYAIKIQFENDYDEAVKEAKLLNQLSKYECFNKCVETFTHSDEMGKNFCMVLELCAGSLYDLMKYGKYEDGFDLVTVKKITTQLLQAITILNDKYDIIHTDIKPENILVAGISNRISDFISEFEKLNISVMLKKYKNKRGFEDMLETKIKTIDFKKIKNKYKDTQTEPINKKYIDNIRIKLSDFGNCKKITYAGYDLQTRYYRAPEMLLHYNYNKNCDMWSVGCCVYELLTGGILFDPQKDKRTSTDRDHLHNIIILLGKPPSSLLKKSKRYDMFFRSDGLLKGVSSLHFIPFNKFLVDKLGNKLSKDDITQTTALLMSMLNYDPFARVDSKTCLQHEWFHV